MVQERQMFHNHSCSCGKLCYNMKYDVKLSLCLINLAPRQEDVSQIGCTAPSFLISALDGGEWQASRPSHFTPEERPWRPLYRRLSAPQSRSGRRGVEKNRFSLLRIEPQPQTVAIPLYYNRVQRSIETLCFNKLYFPPRPETRLQ
jgi:hypothetical protein